MVDGWLWWWVDGLCDERKHTRQKKVEMFFFFRAVIDGVTIDVEFWKDVFFSKLVIYTW